MQTTLLLALTTMPGLSAGLALSAGASERLTTELEVNAPMEKA